MIKLEKAEVFNFEGAIRGMRNPMNSWDKSDSGSCSDFKLCEGCPEDIAADVEIMIQQIVYLGDFEEGVLGFMETKLDRQLERIEAEKED